MRNTNIHYYVEGKNEKKLISVLKSDMGVIKSGKVQKLNVLQSLITDASLRTLKNGTVVVLIFDTDTKRVDILNKNIQKLEACRFISQIITIPQVPNLEGELIRSCQIKRITELLNSRSEKNFKSDFIHVSNLDKKLMEHGFDLSVIWSQNLGTPYQNIINNSEKIKLYDSQH